MKHQQHVDELVGFAEELGISLDDHAAGLLLSHLEWVLETNKTHNLTAIDNVHDGIRLHIVDSIAALPEVVEAPAGDMLDIGSGAGFPGVPLGLLSNRQVTLLDSVSKKVRLVGEYGHAQGLRVETAPLRAEEFAAQRPRHYAVVVARAVSQLPSIVELAAPLLVKGGRFIALKGPIADDELMRGDRAARKCGLSPIAIRRLGLPGGTEERSIIVYEKVGGPSIALPRRIGLAQKSPLA